MCVAFFVEALFAFEEIQKCSKVSIHKSFKNTNDNRGFFGYRMTWVQMMICKIGLSEFSQLHFMSSFIVNIYLCILPKWWVIHYCTGCSLYQSTSLGGILAIVCLFRLIVTFGFLSTEICWTYSMKNDFRKYFSIPWHTCA